MPTPFMHLHTAEQILATMDNDPCHSLLQQEWPAFYLGSIAPDYQGMCDVPRHESHFYTIPVPDDGPSGYERMLIEHPQLANGANLPSAQAVFVAAYGAHLLLDLIWLHEIVYPFFVTHDNWEGREDRRLSHFILLTYLDQMARNALPTTAVTTLASAQPQNWLPFVDDDCLIKWRNLIVEQLYPSAMSQTVTIYAERLSMTPKAFAACLQDPDWMTAQVFDKIPVAVVQDILQQAVPRSIDLITNYLTN